MTASQIMSAAQMWNAGLTSAEIAKALEMQESHLVKFLAAIKHHAKAATK